MPGFLDRVVETDGVTVDEDNGDHIQTENEASDMQTDEEPISSQNIADDNQRVPADYNGDEFHQSHGGPISRTYNVARMSFIRSQLMVQTIYKIGNFLTIMAWKSQSNLHYAPFLSWEVVWDVSIDASD